jgi:hypothetical protein
VKDGILARTGTYVEWVEKGRVRRCDFETNERAESFMATVDYLTKQGAGLVRRRE